MEDPEIADNIQTWEDKMPSLIDEAMLPASEFFREMSDVDGYLLDAEMGVATQLENVEMEFPIQLDIQVTEDGTIILGAAPPLYYVDTTVSPVFHQLKVSIGVSEKLETNAGDHK